MKAKDIKQLTDAELVQKIDEIRKDKFTTRQQSKTGSLENPAKLKQLRQDLARCLTEQNARGAVKQA